MKIISYIAMIATAAFCQLSYCMNQTNGPVNGNKSPFAVPPFDMWTVKLPVGFSVTFVQTNNLVAEVDFDEKEVRVPAMQGISVSCTGPEVMGSTSLSIDHRRFPLITFQAGKPHALSVDMRPRHFSGSFVQAGNRVVKVDFSTKEALVPFGQNIQFSVDGSEWNTSLSIVHQYHTPTCTIPVDDPHAFPVPFVEMRPTKEMKEEKVQEKKESQTKAKGDSELSEILKEGKPPKAPKSLKKNSVFEQSH